MAVVRVPVDDFERGRLPHVCALTGEAGATTRWDLHGESRSGALLLLLFAGVVPYLIVRSLTRKTADGSVWVSEQGKTFVLARRRRTDRRRLLVALADWAWRPPERSAAGSYRTAVGSCSSSSGSS